MATNATTEAIVVNALARAQEYNTIRPVARSVLYRRISIRQQELAIAAARVNRDYYGVAANAVVIGGAIDVNDITSPVQWPEFIDKITVGAVGVGATVAVGAEVSIVRLGDEEAEEPPRVTMRSGVIRQVGTDLANVSSLKVYYSEIPDSLAVDENGTSLVAIPAPYDELLVLDVVRFLVVRSFTGETNDAPKVSALTEIDADVTTWEAKWRAHVADYGATRTRFGR
jgi:hypothetical protein